MKKCLPDFSPETAGGLALLLASVLALVVVNAGGAEIYAHVLEYRLRLGLFDFALEKSIHHWINDGLMVLFFLLVGIEIHKEFRFGALRDTRQALVPTFAAVGGFVVPALIFIVISWWDSAITAGWSIPTATDIAFAVALITALKKFVPDSLRVFLLTLAVVDDLLAIAVIALFYTAELAWMDLFLACMAAALLILKNRMKIRVLWVYALLGIFMWVCVLNSGVHATIAGVMVGLLLPLKSNDGNPAAADIVEHALQPWVRWIVLPLFAFANVGVNVSDMSLQTVLAPLTLAIILGLFFGKQIGVFGSVWIMDRFLSLPRPKDSSWHQIYGVACLCGIGFTMSLFIGLLALPLEMQSNVQLGVIIGSVCSATLAALILVRRAT